MGRSRKKRRHSNLPDIQRQQQDPQQPQSPADILSERAKAAFAVRAEYSSGPLPSPQVLAQYNEVLPGLAERLVQQAEGQTRHRQDLERTVVNANVASEKRGQILGFILALVLGAGGLGLVALGHEPWGISVIMTDVVALAGVYIFGKKKQRDELAEKRQAPGGPPARR